MDESTFKELINSNQARSVKLYLYRQQLESERLKIQNEIVRVEQEMIQLDGSINTLNELIQSESKLELVKSE